MNEEEMHLKHADAVRLLKLALQAKQRKADASSKYDDFTRSGTATKSAGIIRRYLEDHRGEELWDGENRIRATLQTRPGSPSLDWRSLAENAPELALWALQMGLAKLDSKLWERMETARQFVELLDMKGYIAPGRSSDVLQIVQEQ